VTTKIFPEHPDAAWTTRKQRNEAHIPDVDWSNNRPGKLFDCATKDVFGGVLDVAQVKFRYRDQISMLK
jgi:hypothetical protein